MFYNIFSLELALRGIVKYSHPIILTDNFNQGKASISEWDWNVQKYEDLDISIYIYSFTIIQ